MANSAKARGDRAEREVSQLLADLTGIPFRRKLGAGRLDDVGDIDGHEDLVVQVADWQNVTRALREKPEGAEVQRKNADAKLAVTAIRMRGGVWRFVMTPEQFADWIKEAGLA